MSLRRLAESDLALLIEDGDFGFGWTVTVTDPQGNSAEVSAMSNDVSAAVDPDTGVTVSGRMASVVFRSSSLSAAGLSTPYGVPDEGSKPWVVTFPDLGGSAHTFKVVESLPDRTLGVHLCLLAAYTE